MMELRIIKGPTFLPIPKAWEIEVALPTYSPKLASRVYDRQLPKTLDYEGYTYTKAGMTSDACIAYYRRKEN